MSKSEVIFELDKEVFDNIRKTFADKSHVEIGVLKGGGKKGVAQVAAVHEFGSTQAMTPGKIAFFYGRFHVRKSLSPMVIPARSFLRKTVANKGADFIAWLKSNNETFLRYIVTGQWGQALDMMGWRWKTSIKECFATRGFGQWKPLSQLTVWDKGNDVPLIRTGRLESSIDFQVVNK